MFDTRDLLHISLGVSWKYLATLSTICLEVTWCGLVVLLTEMEPFLMSSSGVSPRTSDIKRIVENSPSRSRILVLTFSAMYSIASGSMSAPISSALARRMAHLSSNLGSWRSKAPAQVRREARRSSTDLIWEGRRSEVTMICLLSW